MLSKASKYLLAELQDDQLREALLKGTGMDFECSLNDLPQVVTNFVEGVLLVLERDFVQLTHGKGAKCVQNRTGVQFLLTGVMLGLLYESLPEKAGIEEMVLQVLIIMLDPRTWTRALDMYGPAPPEATPVWQPAKNQRKIRSFSARATQKTMKYKSSRRRESSRSSTTFPVEDPTRCSECQTAFETPDTLQECECGAVIIRYRRLRKADDSSDLSGGLDSGATIQTRPRSRSV